jgi:hypothetical protein
MWNANHEAMHAGFGHHHTTRRRAKDANGRVDDDEACITTIYTSASEIKQRLDTIESQARNLHDLAHLSPGGHGVEDLVRGELHDIDRLSHAVDVWAAWAHGRPVAVADLTDSVEIITDAARQAPVPVINDCDIDRSQWIELLAPLAELLHQQGIDLAPYAFDPEPAGPGLGIEL